MMMPLMMVSVHTVRPPGRDTVLVRLHRDLRRRKDNKVLLSLIVFDFEAVNEHSPFHGFERGMRQRI